MKKTIIFAAALTLLFSMNVQAATYGIDPVHSSVEFKVRHMMVSNVRGNFETFSGKITFDEADPTKGSATAMIEMSSVNTNDDKRDDHLRSGDFFDAEQFPKMTFTSTKIERKGEAYVLHGDLTLHGVTKPVMLDLEYNGVIDDPWGGRRAGFSAEGTIDRRDFGITWNNNLDKGGVAVGNDVQVFLEIEAVKQ